MRKEFIFVILLNFFLISGCISSSNTQTSKAPTAIVTTPIEPANTSISPVESLQITTPNTVDVNIANFDFVPSSVKISVGDTVKWLNLDSVPHHIHGDNFDSGLIQHEYTYSNTFTKPGTYNYICSIHTAMKGTVTVV